MRAIFLYFTGTGNTLRVCQALCEAWRARGHVGELVSVRADTPLPELGAFDRLIVAFPVHGFNAPAPLLNAIRALPAGEGQKAYLVRTSGEPLALNDAAALTPCKRLRARGYEPVGDFHYVMPYNIIFRHTDGMASRMWRVVAGRVAADAAQIESGEGNLPAVGVFSRAVSFVCRIEHVAMPVVGRGFRATEACVGCGLCEKRCPQGNITMHEGRPVFGKACVACMACSFGCPKDAVRIGVLNGWRVNGTYDFNAPSVADDEVCGYCKKSYLEYYHEQEETAEAEE